MVNKRKRKQAIEQHIEIIPFSGEYKQAHDNPELTQNRCRRITEWICDSYHCEIFMQPVDLPDYKEIIAEPMDLSTLLTYTHCPNFAFNTWLEKSRLIWSNARKYNPITNHVHLLAERVGALFELKVIEAQEHPQDDDSERLHDVYYCLIQALSSEECAEHFFDNVNIQQYELYPCFITRPMSFTCILDMLYNFEYTNRYEIESDLNLIVENTLKFNGNTSDFGIKAQYLKGIAQRLLNARHSDVDKIYVLTYDIRNTVIDYIEKISDKQRLEIMNTIYQLCPDSIQENMGISSFTLDYLNHSQFFRVSKDLRSLLVNNAIK